MTASISCRVNLAPPLLCLTRAVIAQLAARRSHNPKVVSSILTHRISPCQYLPEWQAGEQGCRMVMGGEGESERKREVDGEMMRLVGWAGVLGLGRFAGGAPPPPLPLPFPKLRSCCSAETAYEQQLGNLGKGRGRGEGGVKCEHRMLHPNIADLCLLSCVMRCQLFNFSPKTARCILAAPCLEATVLSTGVIPCFS